MGLQPSPVAHKLIFPETGNKYLGLKHIYIVNNVGKALREKVEVANASQPPTAFSSSFMPRASHHRTAYKDDIDRPLLLSRLG